jgi:hypothetical protein
MSPRSPAIASVPRFYGPCIYVVGLTDGTVKVGRTGQPRTRMETLSDSVRRRLGVDIESIYVSRELSARRAGEAERAVIARLRAVASQLPKSLEFFTGISFDAAVEIAGEVARARA